MRLSSKEGHLLFFNKASYFRPNQPLESRIHARSPTPTTPLNLYTPVTESFYQHSTPPPLEPHLFDSPLRLYSDQIVFSPINNNWKAKERELIRTASSRAKLWPRYDNESLKRLINTGQVESIAENPGDLDARNAREDPLQEEQTAGESNDYPYPPYQKS